MATIEIDPAHLYAQAQGLAGAAVAVDQLTSSVRVCAPSTGDPASQAALAALLRTLDEAVLGLATAAGEVAVTLAKVAVAYAAVDGQG